MGVINMDKLLLVIKIFILFNGFVQSQNVYVEPSNTILVEMSDEVNLTCSASNDNFGPIEACVWINTKLNAPEMYKNYEKYDGYYDYNEYLRIYNFQKKIPCLPGLKVSDNMICGGKFQNC